MRSTMRFDGSSDDLEGRLGRIQNIDGNIAKGTTDPGVDCFDQ